MNLYAKKEFKDNELVEKLKTYDCHNQIEHLLNEELEEFKIIDKLTKTKQIKKGRKVTKKELIDIANKAFLDVNNFFEIDNTQFPHVEQFSLLQKENRHILTKYITSNAFVMSSAYLNANEFSNWAIPLVPASIMLFYAVRSHIKPPSATYIKKQQKIKLSKFKKTKLIPIIAHEYTHHLQNLNNNITKNFGIFIEGQARMVDKHIAKKYSARENNKAYSHEVLNRSVHELMSAYIWLSKELKKQPNASLTNEHMFQYSDDMQYLSENKIPHNHALGNAYMSTHPQNQKILLFAEK